MVSKRTTASIAKLFIAHQVNRINAGKVQTITDEIVNALILNFMEILSRVRLYALSIKIMQELSH